MSNTTLLKEAQRFHAALLTSGFRNHAYRCNLLLRAYARCGALSHARSLLLQMPLPTLVSFNTLLSGFVRSGRIDDAIDLFDAMPATDAHSYNTVICGLVRIHRVREAFARFLRMARSHVRPDDFTCSTIVACCDLSGGRQLHALMVKVASLTSDPFAGTNLLRMYGDAGEMCDARKVFDEMGHRDLTSWNVLIDCYFKSGMGELCIKIFVEMVRDRIRLDEFTLATVMNELASCSSVSKGMQVHSLVVRAGFIMDRFCCNALLNLYSKGGFVSSAMKLFDDMTDPDVVSWTIMISGLEVGGHIIDAFEVFNSMRMAEVEPNSFTFGTLIGCCANVNAFDIGKQFHALVLKNGLELDVVVGSTIVNMYSKCGEITDALRLFQSLPERDIVSWNGVICGLAQNGEATTALQLFDEMVQLRLNGIMPNHVTFVGVLTACSRAGLIRKGCSIFNDMVDVYSCEPQAEHYACMVDLFARSGLLEEAEVIIQSLSTEPNIILWGALLGACKSRGNLVMAKRIVKRLYVSEPMNSSDYVLLANLYAANKEWDDVFKVSNAPWLLKSKKAHASLPATANVMKIATPIALAVIVTVSASI
ncbi:unnamed protein product [Musa hybrid cultivar]